MAKTKWNQHVKFEFRESLFCLLRANTGTHLPPPMDQIAEQTDGTCIGRATCVVYEQKQAEEVCAPSGFATTITAAKILRLLDQ